MNDFLLDRRTEAVFPRKVVLCGKEYGICSDFRQVLKILRMLEDEEILERHKYGLLCRWFLAGADERAGKPADKPGVKPPDKPPEKPTAEFARACVDCFVGFVLGAMDAAEDVGGEGGSERRFDFIFDAREIYVSFLREYGMDLFEVEALHFYKFCLMLAHLSEESPLKQKIAVRFYDLSGLKGQALAEMSAAKERAQLPERLSAAELAEREEFRRLWGQL